MKENTLSKPVWLINVALRVHENDFVFLLFIRHTMCRAAIKLFSKIAVKVKLLASLQFFIQTKTAQQKSSQSNNI